VHDPRPGPGIGVDEHHLLPRSEWYPSLHDGQGHGRSDHGCTDVAVSVVVMPRLFVLVAGVPGGDAFERGGDVVVHQPWLVFEGGERGCGALNHEGGLAGADTGFGNGGLELSGEVDDVVVPSRAALQRAMFGDHV